MLHDVRPEGAKSGGSSTSNVPYACACNTALPPFHLFCDNNPFEGCELVRLVGSKSSSFTLAGKTFDWFAKSRPCSIYSAALYCTSTVRSRTHIHVTLYTTVGPEYALTPSAIGCAMGLELGCISQADYNDGSRSALLSELFEFGYIRKEEKRNRGERQGN